MKAKKKSRRSRIVARASLHQVRGEPRGLRIRFGKTSAAYYAFDPDSLGPLETGVSVPPSRPPSLCFHLGAGIENQRDWDTIGYSSVSIDHSGGIRVYVGTRILQLDPGWDGIPFDIEGTVVFPRDGAPRIILALPEEILP